MRTINRIFCSLLLAGACSLGAIAQENQSYFLHTIEKGQSLYSISSMYGVTQSDIVKLNPGSDEKIFVGRTLRIPRTAANTQTETFHTIAQGETLYRLTVKYGVSAKAICDANPGLSAENFRIGQVIRIPSASEADVVTTENVTEAAIPTIQGPVQSRCRDMHKVKRKETVYSISREYGISEAELIAANPELQGEDKIKKGTFLCIPYPTAQVEKPAQPQVAPSNSELFSENKKETERFSTIKAALILPFLDVSKSEAARMVEYYEGFLIAVDSLKRSGVSIDLYTYNSGPENASLNPILSKKEMKDMDIIFGPLHQQQVKPLADFAQKNDIRLVVPFTSKDNNVFRNPSIYQINTPQSYLYSEVYDHFVRQFPNANVIFIEASTGTKDKVEFIKGLKDELKNRFGKEVQIEVFRSAGRKAGEYFAKNMLNLDVPQDQFVNELQKKMQELKIGVLRIEDVNEETGKIILTVAEDADCSGLPVLGETVCNYDEGFIAGILSLYFGKPYTAVEVDCWATGDRVCRFHADVQE